jgi:hypothetical protein
MLMTATAQWSPGKIFGKLAASESRTKAMNERAIVRSPPTRYDQKAR